MDIVPIVDTGLGNSSYVVDLGDGSALVVDPERDPSPYLEAAEQRNLRPRFTVETHLHADFVSGSRELMAAGAALLAPAESDLSLDYRRLDDGDEIDLGGLTLRAIATPGHTPEHLAYLLLDGAVPRYAVLRWNPHRGRSRTHRPAFTGLVGASGAGRVPFDRRPDSDAPRRPAGISDPWGWVVLLRRAHRERTTTIGRERRSNPLLQIDTEDEFVAALLGGFGSYPSYFGRMRELNRAGPTV